MPESRVLVVGPTSENLIVALERLPEPTPHTVFARAHRTAIGGTSAGKALHLAHQGVPVTLLTTQGDDATGAALTARLAECGVDVRPVPTTGPSERHLNLMSERGERVSIFLQECADITTESLRGARAVAMEHMRAGLPVFLDLSALSRSLIPEAAALAHEVWVDIHDYDGADAFHRPFIEAADVVLMNRDRMRTPGPFLRDRIDAGASLAICTLGADGALGVAADGTTARVPAVPVDVVDPNGAGDAFAAGVMAFALEVGGAAHVTGALLEQALSAGAAQAAHAVGSPELSPLLER